MTVDPEIEAVEDDAVNSDMPPPKYEPLQTCYARDSDGVVYEAVIRRRIYGRGQHKQLQLALIDSEEGATTEGEQPPKWHYFVHYQNWNVNWDRFVEESDIFPVTEQVKQYTARLLEEHRALKSAHIKKVKGKKGFQTIDSTEFLRDWRRIRLRVDREMGFADDARKQEGVPSPTVKLASTGSKQSKGTGWAKSELKAEQKLREKSLTQQFKNNIALPFALKKSLVEQWEIITQCEMVPTLPAKVTIRQALDKYLDSKGVGARLMGVSSAADEVTEEGDEEISTAAVAVREQEWREMVDGIALFFDEALPRHLLYREEIPQLHVIEQHPEYSQRRYSEIYGCEHLLRLFVRFSEVLGEEYGEDEARQIFAKVNDLVRFLHKNQGAFLAQPYRKLNEEEEREQSKILKADEKKRKRANNILDDESETKRLKATD